jgi:D-alanyl-D-alanine carboxypeptidase
MRKNPADIRADRKAVQQSLACPNSTWARAREHTYSNLRNPPLQAFMKDYMDSSQNHIARILSFLKGALGVPSWPGDERSPCGSP